MRFELQHHFPYPLDSVAGAILDRGYQESLSRIGPLKSRTLLSQQAEGDGVVRRVRCVLEADFAGPVKAMLGSTDAAWVEESTWFPDQTMWKWTIVPEVAANLISAGGVMALLSTGESTTRIVSGEVDVNVPFLGGRVEQTIVDGVRQTYDEEAGRLTRWLDTHG